MKKTQTQKIEEQGEIDAIEQLRRLTSQMGPDERERLGRLGVVIPEGDIASAVEGRYKFGVRCTQCNQVALFFVGDKWTLNDGTETDVPPPWPHQRIAWTQNLPASKIDRQVPRCQNCGHKVATEGAGQFRRDRGRIVEVGMFMEGRDAAYDRKKLTKFRKEVHEGGGAVVDLSSSYDEARQPVSAVIAEQRGGDALKEIEHLAEITGVTDALLRPDRTG